MSLRDQIALCLAALLCLAILLVEAITAAADDLLALRWLVPILTIQTALWLSGMETRRS